MLTLIGFIASLNILSVSPEGIELTLNLSDTGFIASYELNELKSPLIAPVEEAILVSVTPSTKLDTGIFMVPVSDYVITGRYGDKRATHIHKGLDFAAPVGALILASDGGIVTYSGYEKDYGNLIIIDHGNGYETFYAHLNDLGAALGETVPKGRAIGWVGSTGRSTGPHLHFEIRKNGISIDPGYFMKY
jgi:murein DD-endopeptidase MepM/ murein hydrolase activator NlpD